MVSGGFPCQDISIAGRGDGLDGERSGLWSEYARIIREVRPRYVFVENSPMLTSRGLDRVLADLAESGFDAEWGVLSASAVGAPHRRARIWIVGRDANGHSEPGLSVDAEAPGMSSRWGDHPEPLGMDDGLGNELDRLRALGNGQVPQCAAEAWRQLMGRITHEEWA